MFEIMLSNGTSYKVANQELGKQISNYDKASTQERQGQWLKAYSIAKVVVEKLYEKDGDFQSLENFLDLVELKPSTARKYVRVVAFKESHKDLKDLDYLTINSIDCLAGIEKLDKFIKFIAKKGYDSFNGISELKMADLKKEFLDKENKKAKKETSETETGETETGETETSETKAVEYVIITYQGKKYKLDKAIFETLEEVK